MISNDKKENMELRNFIRAIKKKRWGKNINSCLERYQMSLARYIRN